jgi:predicted N-acyltransferase
VSVVSSISLVSAEAWDLCALEAAGPESVNPFVSHAFLSSLEDSKSAVAVSSQKPNTLQTIMQLLKHVFFNHICHVCPQS